MRDDTELVILAQEKDENAENELHNKYMPLIISKSKKVYNYIQSKGLELSDVIQECIIGFEEAIVNYNQDDKTKFITFANICMDRQLNSFVLKVNREKHKILNDAIPFESFNDYGDETNLLNVLGDKLGSSEDQLMDIVLERELISQIKKRLTDFENLIFEFKLQGFSYKEIADTLDKDIKSIDNAVQRMRQKIRELINK